LHNRSDEILLEGSSWRAGCLTKVKATAAAGCRLVMHSIQSTIMQNRRTPAARERHSNGWCLAPRLPAAMLLALPIVLAAAAGAMAHAAPVASAPGPAQWLWSPELAPDGPLLVIVVIAEQRAYVYRNGVRIGLSSASTGRSGHETPPGVYTILQKRREHYSNLFDDAPMPFMQRLTWDGIALHAGAVPGYPASHGCVRLPEPFAQLLFEATRSGTTVVVSQHGAEVLQAGLRAPLAAADPSDAPGLDWRWTPEWAPVGPLSVIVSLADRTVLVLRNGVEIGHSAIGLAAGGVAAGTRAFVVLEGEQAQPSALLPDRPARRWLEAGATDGVPAGPLPMIELPPAFAPALYDARAPGSTVVVTDAPLGAGDAGLGMVILVSGEAVKGGDG
jgi:hypothetical protein